MTVAERFSANLKAARQQAGLSQEATSFRADIHRTEVGLLETALRKPRLETLLKLAAAVGVEPGELLAGLRWIPKEFSGGRWEIEPD